MEMSAESTPNQENSGFYLGQTVQRWSKGKQRFEDWKIQYIDGDSISLVKNAENLNANPNETIMASAAVVPVSRENLLRWQRGEHD